MNSRATKEKPAPNPSAQAPEGAAAGSEGRVQDQVCLLLADSGGGASAEPRAQGSRAHRARHSPALLPGHRLLPGLHSATTF